MFAAEIMFLFATTEYEDFIGEFVSDFEELMEALDILLAWAEEFEDDDDVFEWAEYFFDIKDAVFLSFFTLAAIEDLVPEEYEEAHALITLAVFFIHEAMEAFESAVDAVFDEDYDAFEEAIGEFLEYIEAAAELWAAAVE
jgi:hypothetical protein